MLAPSEEMHLLGADDPFDDAARDVLQAANEDLQRSRRRAFDRGYRRGLLDVGVVRVSALALAAGALLGWAACVVWRG